MSYLNSVFREELPNIYKCPYQGCTAVYRAPDGLKVRISSTLTLKTVLNVDVSWKWKTEKVNTILCGFVETHQGASRGGERTTLSSSRLQQSFYDWPLPAAACQAHPHRLGQKGLWKLPYSHSMFYPFNVSIAHVKNNITLRLQFLNFQRRGIIFVTSVAKPLNRGNIYQFTRWDIQGRSHCSKIIHFIRDYYQDKLNIVDKILNFIVQKSV